MKFGGRWVKCKGRENRHLKLPFDFLGFHLGFLPDSLPHLQAGKMRGARKGKGGPRAPDWPDFSGYFCVLAREAVSALSPLRGVIGGDEILALAVVLLRHA